jgi:hypothetical protein
MPLAHTVPQLPQWEGLLVVVTHWFPQKVCPDGQTHEVPEQERPPLQALPQAPQCALLLVVIVH